MNIICLDTETTGLSHFSDELLQVSIVDAEGRTLFNERFKPVHATSWDEAQKINGITPESVQNCKPFSKYAQQIQRILSESDVIIGYNLKDFDLPFLSFGGVDVKCLKPAAVIIDIMQAYAPIHGEWMEWKHDYKWQKLETCAAHYGYSCSHWHDALDDAKATLFCYHSMYPDGIPESGYGISIARNTYIPVPAPYNALDENVKPQNEKKKTGRIMITFGILFVIGSIGSFQFGGLIFAALLLFFGIRRYKAYKNLSE